MNSREDLHYFHMQMLNVHLIYIVLQHKKERTNMYYDNHEIWLYEIIFPEC